jgi:drug/metabolite transporter (DMT)-like permease
MTFGIKNMTRPAEAVPSGIGARRDAAARPQQRLKGALILSLAVAVTALQDAFIKDLSQAYPVHQMQTFRAGAALLLIFGWIAANGGLPALLRTRPGGLLALRSAVLAMASLTFYTSLAAMPFADAVAIYFSMPLMIAALSGLVIGEHVPPWRWVAVAIGFVGVVIVQHPGVGVFEPASLVVLFSTLCYALGLMLTRPVGMRVNSAVMGFWQLVGFLVTGVALSLVFGGGSFHDAAHPSLSYLTAGWVAPSWTDVAKLLGFGVAAAAATILYTAGYKVAAPSFVAPFEYSALLWASLLGFVLWGDVPGAGTLGGAALIVAAGLWMIAREARQKSEVGSRKSEVRSQKSEVR